jgi:putative DNA primase/helicase
VNPLLDAALVYAARGWPVFPVHTPTEHRCSCPNSACPTIGKHPRTQHGLKDATVDSTVITKWWSTWPDANIGLVTGSRSGLVALDIDRRHGGDDTLAELERKYGPLPDTVRNLTGGGWHELFAYPNVPVKSKANLAPGVDSRASDGYIVVPPSRHASGQNYGWEVGHSPDDLALASLPAWLLTLLTSSTHPSPNQPLRKTVTGSIREGGRNAHLTSHAGAMRRRDMSPEAIETALLTENVTRCEPPLSHDEVRGIARGITRYEPVPSPQSVDFHLTDWGNAQRLVSQHGQDLHYLSPWGVWFIWNGQNWVKDQTGEVERRAKQTVALLHEEAAGLQGDQHKALAQHAKKSEAEARINAMISLAKSEPTIPLMPGQLDASPWLLNCPNGTLDLKTGQLHPHRREDCLSKIIPVLYDPTAECSLWRQFLARITGDNPALMSFLQRSVGYALTGDTSEQVIFLLYGTGANGKTTFLEAIRALLGSYALTADTSTFLARNGDSVRNDVARLVGARFVSAVEVERGRRLAEVLIKQLTGGDTMTARFLYHEFFEFQPTFKLFVAVNHKPVIGGADPAIWRRMRLIPFTVTIPERERDKELPAKLRSELPGILAWAIQGCQAWQTEGLGFPQEIRDATDCYREEMDVLAGFLAGSCVLGPQYKASAKDLYAVYIDWCQEAQENPLSKQAFGGHLRERGLTAKKSTGGRYFWYGLGLPADSMETSGPSGP